MIFVRPLEHLDDEWDDRPEQKTSWLRSQLFANVLKMNDLKQISPQHTKPFSLKFYNLYIRLWFDMFYWHFIKNILYHSLARKTGRIRSIINGRFCVAMVIFFLISGRNFRPRWVYRTTDWLTRWLPIVAVGYAVIAVGIISKIKSKINSIRNSDLMKDNSQSKL